MEQKSEAARRRKPKGDFTLPGEAGYEKLTLRLAEKWGADVVRDSDGTQLSPEILSAGYGVYSTICVIREHNDFAKAHPETQAEAPLYSLPVAAESANFEVAFGVRSAVRRDASDERHRETTDPTEASRAK